MGISAQRHQAYDTGAFRSTDEIKIVQIVMLNLFPIFRGEQESWASAPASIHFFVIA